MTRVKTGRLLLALLLMLLFIFPAVAEEGPNLLYNGDFEELDEDGLPVGWYTDEWIHQEGYTIYQTSDDARSGEKSAVVNNLGLNDARFAQTVSVEPESLYCLSGWIKATDVSEEGRGANLSIEGLYAFSQSLYETDGEWCLVEMYGETGPEQYGVTVFARLGGYSGESTGVAQFDGLSLRKVDAVPGDGVAKLWFTPEVPEIQPMPEETETEEAKPFLPWLMGIAAVYAFAVATAMKRFNKNELPVNTGRNVMPWVLAVGLVASFAVRVVVASFVTGYPVDVNCFLSWGNTMAQVGPGAFYQTTSFCDYSPGYIYVMGLNGWITNLVGNYQYGAMIHKMIPMISDVVMAMLLYVIGRQRKLDDRTSTAVALLFAFNPAMILNSAAWCQIDSVLCLLLMLVAWLAIREKWAAVLPVYVLAILVKPQALMMGFLGLAAIVLHLIQHRKDNKVVWKQILIGLGLSAVVAAVIVLPFSPNQETPLWLINLYGETLASYPYATVNAANIYYLFGANWSPIADLCGVAPALVFCGLSILWTVYIFITHRRDVDWYAVVQMVVGSVFALAFMVMAFLPVSWTALGTSAMVMVFLLILPMYFRGGKLENLPLCGAAIFLLLHVFGIKMHERYLFPALILLAMADLLRRDRRILILLGMSTVTVFLNEGIVLDNAIRLGSSMGHLNNDTLVINNIISVINVLTALLGVWTCHSVCLGVENDGFRLLHKVLALKIFRTREVKETPGTPEQYRTWNKDASLHWKGLDWLLMLSVTVVYAVVCLTTLGSTKAPQTPWKSSSVNEEVVIDLGQHYDDVSMLYFAQVSYHNFTVAVSDDGENWSEEYWAQMNEGQCFRWVYLVPAMEHSSGEVLYTTPNTVDGVQKLSGRYVRISARQIGLTLNEVIFKDSEGEIIPARAISQHYALPESPNYSDISLLTDEQDTLDGEPGWWNSTYFDEIYHARTAYEHLHGLTTYEVSHPPLGKVIMSWAVGIFGMTPFGWRFAGAMAGILMLPAMYLLGKQLTKKTWLAFAAMLLMALDCMHFTQTRIATIDSYPVLFIILSYLFMLRFMQRDIILTPMKKLLPDLALSGLFMGCGIASKWIGLYSAVGLALLYFWTCLRHVRLGFILRRRILNGQEVIEEDRKRAETCVRRIIYLCLCCVGFFVAVPAVIYVLSYIPYFAYRDPGSIGEFLRLVVDAQENMFSYHSTPGLGMDHPFYSPWYEWPLISRPMYYASPRFVPEGWSYALFCFGNPAVWVFGLVAILWVALVWAKRHRYTLAGSDYLWHLKSKTFDVSPAVVLIGLMAQFIPWVLVPRSTFIYHYFASVPFLILATALVFHWFISRFPRNGKTWLVLLLVVSLAFFIGFFPYASGLLAPTGWLDFMQNFLHVYY